MNEHEINLEKIKKRVSELESEIAELKKPVDTHLISDSLTKYVLDHLLEGAQIIDNEWKYIYLNETALAQSSKRREELEGKKFTEVWAGIEETELYLKIKACLEEKTASNFENRFIFNDGSIGWFLLNIQPVEAGAFILSVDISQIKDTEEKLNQIVRENQLLIKSLQEQNQKLAETQISLSKSENHFRLIIENSPFGIFIQSEGRFAYLNNKALEFWGAKKSEELVGSRILEVVHPDYHEYVISRMKGLNVDRKQQPVGELKIKRLDGSCMVLETHGVPYEYENKNGALVFMKDLTEKRKYEKAIIESEEKFRKIFENHSAVKILVDSESYYIVDANKSAEKMYGWSIEELKQKRVWDLTDISEDEAKKRVEVIKEKRSLNYQTRHKRANNGRIDVEVYSSLIELGEKKLIHAIVVDITEKKLNEKKLKLLSHAVEQSSVEIMITDSKGTIEYVNPSFTEKSGYSFEEVVGNNPRFLKSGFHPEIFYRGIWETILNGDVWEGEIRNKKKSGELYWDKAIISPLSDENGVITHFVAVNEDISDKKKMIEDLVSAKQKAEEMNRVKSYFFANMSHELRTPFVGIMGFSELLFETINDPEMKEMAENILISSTRMKNTLSKILSLSKLESDKAVLSPENFNIKGFFESVCKDYYKEIKKKNLQIGLIFNVDSETIYTDKAVLEEVLRNLINNAVIYTDFGRIDIIVESKKDTGNNTLIIKVRDTGIGIPADKLDLIWQEFRQASEGLARSFEGTGIGLTITKKDVQLLGGKISLKSEEGKGSEFTVEIPIQNAPVIKAEKRVSGSEMVEERRVKERKRILHIEDDYITRLVMKRAFSKVYDIEFCPDAEKSLKKIKEENFDLILMDINLGPGLNGKELTKIIREIPEYKSIPIVAVTAYSNTQDKNDFFTAGISHYILNPFMMKDMKLLLEGIFRDIYKAR